MKPGSASVDALLADPDFMAASRIRRLLAEAREEWADLDRRIEALDLEFAELARDNEAARRLVSIPGIGVLNATALVAAVEMARPLPKHATSAPGWDLYRDNIQPAANRSCSASPNAATSTCERC